VTTPSDDSTPDEGGQTLGEAANLPEDFAAEEVAETGAAAEAERTRLDSESEQRRTTVEEDFEIAMASRRTESMRALAEQEAKGRDGPRNI